MKKKLIMVSKLLMINFMIIFTEINVFADSTCQGNCLKNKIDENILRPLKFIAPILLLVFTTIDFAKVVFSDNKDGMSKAWNNFIKRAVATLLVFFAQNIVDFIYIYIK